MNEGRQTSAAAKSANKTAETLPAKTATAPTLPPEVARRGISEAIWRTLMNSLYPGAAGESVLMVVDYCIARKLDPMKKPCHIVPMNVKDAKTGSYNWRDVVMPGIYEYRTTAMRTGLYLGHSKPEYGPMKPMFGVDAPEWCEMTVYRWSEVAKEKLEFPVRVYFEEAVATRKDKDSGGQVANDRWSRAPIQMLTKCTEAAGLREAFPDEFGGEVTAEEIDGRNIDSPISDIQRKPETEAPQEKAPEPAPPAAIPHITQNELLSTLDKLGIPEKAVLEKFEVGSLDELGHTGLALAKKWASTVNG